MRFKAALVVLVLAGAAPAPVWGAQIFEGYSTSAPGLEIDPSVRSVGVAGASSAVFWGADPNYWANPALLGYSTGMRYEEGTADYGFGMHLLTQRATLGYLGLGVSIAGQPFDGLHQKLDLSFLGWPEFSERIQSWGLGASLGSVATEYARWRGHEPPALTRYLDLAVGYNERRLDDALGGTPQDHLVARDWGALARVTASLRVGRALLGRLEGAYGFSILNYEEAGIAFISSPIPGARDTRNGVAVRVALSPARGLPPALPDWIARGLEPLISLGAARDFGHTTQGIVGAGGHAMDAWGAELGLGNLVFARIGRGRGPLGDATQDAWGLGFGLPVGRFGGLRYDHANITRGPDLPELKRQSWSAWLDPVAIYRSIR